MMELWRAEPGDVLRLPPSCWPRIVEVTDAEGTGLKGDWTRLHWETDTARGSTILPDMLEADLLHTGRADKRPFLAAGAGWLEGVTDGRR